MLRETYIENYNQRFRLRKLESADHFDIEGDVSYLKPHKRNCLQLSMGRERFVSHDPLVYCYWPQKWYNWLCFYCSFCCLKVESQVYRLNFICSVFWLWCSNFYFFFSILINIFVFIIYYLFYYKYYIFYMYYFLLTICIVLYLKF